MNNVSILTIATGLELSHFVLPNQSTLELSTTKIKREFLVGRQFLKTPF
jgi:hypothetical protein